MSSLHLLLQLSLLLLASLLPPAIRAVAGIPSAFGSPAFITFLLFWHPCYCWIITIDIVVSAGATFVFFLSVACLLFLAVSNVAGVPNAVSVF
jgi:hypothetical protein